MEITFVSSYERDPAKRTRPPRACESCKKRKKRCIHTENTDNASQRPKKPRPASQSRIPKEIAGRPKNDCCHRLTGTHQSSPSQPRSSSRGSEEFRATTTQIRPPYMREPSIGGSHQSPTTETPHSISQRFIGDLNPEATFLEQVPAAQEITQQQSTRDHVGIWIDKSEWDAMHWQKQIGRNINDDTANTTSPEGSITNNVTLFEILDQAALIETYFSRVHPILPILDEAEFRQSYRDKTASSLLVKAICLVASKDTRAEPYLRLRPDQTTILKPRDFSKAIHTSIRDALKIDTQRDRITLIRVLTLTSLHSEGLDGAEEASMYLAQAIHHSQTIGLHLRKAGDPTNHDSLKKLFWCVWSLDKLNSATNGRPVMINDHHLGVVMYASGKPEDAAFEVWLRIAAMLNQVINLYRPSTPPSVTGWEDEFPIFEEIVEEQKGWHLSTSILATLHLFYLIVAVLSSRSRAIKDIPRATPSHIRQSLSTQYIISLMDGSSDQDLHPLPIYSYGISLALSVAYKHMRQSRLVHQQQKAKLDFQTCFKILQDLRSKWWSADITATLAGKVLGDLDKVSSLAEFRVHPNQNALPSSAPPARVDSGSRSPPEVQWIQPSNDSAPRRSVQSTDHSINAGEYVPYKPLCPDQQQVDQSNDQTGFGFHDSNQNEISASFDGMDDIFGAYMDLYSPINFEEIIALQSDQIDWNSIPMYTDPSIESPITDKARE